MRSPCARSVRSGFTLVEVLVVIAVMAILAGILLNVRSGVRERAKVTLAEGELSAMAQALERYRSEHGDFPWLQGGEDDAVRLYRALTNRTLPNGQAFSGGTSFLDTNNFQLASPGAFEPIGNGTWRAEADYVILDPWGQPYRFAYRQSARDTTWRHRGFILLSTGPSGALAADMNELEDPAMPTDGVIDESYFSAAGDTSVTYDNLLAQP